MGAPNFKTFPLIEWEKNERFFLKSKNKLCPALSHTDDFLLKRGDFFHHANDLFCSMNTPNVAVTDGVTWARPASSGKRENGDRYALWPDGGWHVYIKGDDGYIYYYAHLRDEPLVKIGERVRAGQLIGYTGRSGNTAGCPHTHFAMYKYSEKNKDRGEAINPYPYLKATRPAATGRTLKVVGGGIVGLIAAGVGGFFC